MHSSLPNHSINISDAELFTISGSPTAWRVQLAFAFKNANCNLRMLQGSKGEHRDDAYLAINPRGKVPALKFGDIVVRDSMAILSWLEAIIPEPSLLGATPAETARVLSYAYDADEYLLHLTNAALFPVFRSEDRYPFESSFETDIVNAACEDLRAEWSALEASLGAAPYFGAQTPSISDAVIYPEFGRLLRALQTKPGLMEALGFTQMQAKFPNLFAWYQRVLALPGVPETTPIHWKEKRP